MTLSPEVELLRRRRAVAGVVDYARYTYRRYRPADHHFQIGEALERVERGETKRQMIFMPPRHGKSETASRRFPAWFMGRNPDRDIIAASYNSDLAGDFGREVRNIMASREHGILFPGSSLSEDSRNQKRWHTAQGGGYTAAGVGTAVTGRGAHVFLIDDPVKDRESADSETIRNKTYGWYLSTAYTRLEGDIGELDPDPLWRDAEELYDEAEPFEGAIILIQTRWHEDDLSGRLLRDMERGGDQWEILSLPAIKEEGPIYEALWPQKFPLRRLKEIKAALTNREWNALYQQQPVPEDGTFFKKEWLQRHENTPNDLAVVMTSDFAVSDDEKADFTELAVWGLNADEGAYLLDWWSGQETAMVWIEKAILLMKKWKPQVFFGESGVIRRAVEPSLRRRMREQRTFCRLEWITRTSDKVASARGFQARMEMGMVSFPHQDFADRVLNQLLQFPSGLHDDAVDACALLGMALDKTHPAITHVSAPPEPMRPDDYGVDLEEDNVINWKTA